MGKGDHIVIPKATLKRFSGKDNKISELNILDGKIRRIYPDSVFVELEYYDDVVDKYIKDNVESVLGKLNKVISDNIGKDFRIKKSSIELMEKIFVIQRFRNNDFRKKSNNKHENIGKNEHNFYLKQLIKYLEEGNAINRKLEDLMLEIRTYTPGYIILEDTERKFILPECQFALIVIKGINTYCMPIAPNIALIWRKLSEKKEIDYGKTSDNDAVDKINQLIIDFEKSKKTEYFIYGREQEINYYRNKLFATEGQSW